MTLDSYRGMIARAQRSPITDSCATGAIAPGASASFPPLTATAPGEWFPVLTHVIIDVANAGDNILIAPGGALLIHAIELWNVSAQTLTLCNGPSATAGSRLTRLSNAGDKFGYLLGLSKMPWYEVDAGKPLILNCSAGTQVDGWVKYRVKAT